MRRRIKNGNSLSCWLMVAVVALVPLDVDAIIFVSARAISSGHHNDAVGAAADDAIGAVADDAACRLVIYVCIPTSVV